jgi:hypothetical protein
LGFIAIPLPLSDAVFGALGPQMHHRHQYIQFQDELIDDTGDKTPNFQWAPPQGQS